MSEINSNSPDVLPEVAEFLGSAHHALIGAQWKMASDGRMRDVCNPANGDVIATVAECGPAEVDAAVKAASASFKAKVWRGTSVSERTQVLLRFADLIERDAEMFAQIDVLDNGMPIWLARMIIASGIEGLRYAAMIAATLTDENFSAATSSADRRLHAYSATQPIGVAALIIPWNGPAASFLVKAAPALAAGCSCIVKPAELTPLSALLLGKLALEAGVPEGVLNIVTGDGKVVGNALVEHPLVDKVSFTGSTVIGKEIARRAADRLKRVTLELGGKSPTIVFDDADLELAIPGAAMAVFANSGQMCIAGSRLFVQRKVFDKVVAGIGQVAGSLKIGNGMDPNNQLGPVISAQQRDRIAAIVAEGQEQGAEIVCGGGSPSGNGFFVEPTVVVGADKDSSLIREEIFGPVIAAIPFDDLDDVIPQANDSRYGLAAGVFTTDVNKAHIVADELEAGNVWVNCYGVTHPMVPFGGFKESGWGREFGVDGLQSYRESKSVVVQLHGS